jgi:RsmE family RNA methyltransferase
MNIVLLPQHTQNIITLTDSILLNHLHQVLKAQVGYSIKVGVVQGNLGTAVIDSLTDTSVTLNHIDCPTPPPTKLPLTVVLALPRPKVLRRLILDMTAMGVRELYLVNSYRSEKSYWQSPLINKIDDYIQEGLQQACDTVPMQVHLKKRLKPFVEDELPSIIGKQQAIIAHPYADDAISRVWQPQQPSVLVIGAEGGFIPYEVALFSKVGCTPAHMGTRILRTENAVNLLCGHALLAQQN